MTLIFSNYSYPTAWVKEASSLRSTAQQLYQFENRFTRPNFLIYGGASDGCQFASDATFVSAQDIQEAQTSEFFHVLPEFNLKIDLTQTMLESLNVIKRYCPASVSRSKKVG